MTSLRKPGSLWVVLLATLCFLIGSTGLHAQYDSAAVLGYVRDSSGAVVVDAQVSLTNTATNVTVVVKTNKDGLYEFDGIKSGDYRIDTDAANFAPAHTEKFSLTTNARQRVDVNVQAGSVTSSVDVTSTATMLETETSSRATVIGTREVENLPLNGRSYADLVLLVPGAASPVLRPIRPPAARDRSISTDSVRHSITTCSTVWTITTTVRRTRVLRTRTFRRHLMPSANSR